jgi:3-dehydroquinate synthetase
VKLKKAYLAEKAVVQAMKQDKKRTGTGLPLVMIAGQYQMMKASDVTPEEITDALRQLHADLELI